MNIFDYANRKFDEFMNSDAFAKMNVEQRARWLHATEVVLDAFRTELGRPRFDPRVSTKLRAMTPTQAAFEDHQRRLAWAESTLQAFPHCPA